MRNDTSILHLQAYICDAYVPTRKRGSNRKDTTLSQVNINEPCPQVNLVRAVSNKNDEELTNVDNKRTSKINRKRRHEETMKAKKTKKRSVPKKPNYARLGLEPPPELSQEVMDFIKQRGGTDVNLVIMKALFKTDLEKHQDRLSIPVSQVRCRRFMTEIEEQVVADGGVHVNLVEPVGLNVCSMKLKKWSKNSQYVLTTSWNGVIDRNKEVLRVGSIVQVWSFRINGELWFALVKV